VLTSRLERLASSGGLPTTTGSPMGYGRVRSGASGRILESPRDVSPPRGSITSGTRAESLGETMEHKI
jgi:hypothetical protein